MASFLMWKNKAIMKFDLDEGIYDIYIPEKLPFQLKKRLLEPLGPIELPKDAGEEMIIKYFKDRERRTTKIHDINRDAVEGYFASRVLPLTRKNAKKIYNLLHLVQSDSPKERAMVALAYRSLSLSDNYWVRDEEENIAWQDVNLHTNPIDETVAQVALHGVSCSVQGKPLTPEVTTQGTYAKAWIREPDGLFLYKLGQNVGGFYDDSPARIEVAVSELLDKTNVNHVRYYDAYTKEKYACKCKCMTNDSFSIISAAEYRSYCRAAGKDFNFEIERVGQDDYYRMLIVDYLISNGDRHMANWGFYYDSYTMEVKGLHPLFDHNNAFDEDFMDNKQSESRTIPGYDMNEVAEYAMKRTDFYFVENVSRKDFMEKVQYESFVDRAYDLGVKIGD